MRSAVLTPRVAPPAAVQANPIDPVEATVIMQRVRRKLTVDPVTDCWLWTRCITSKGYGRTGAGGKWLVHRLSWVAAHGCDVPGGLVVDHLCRVPNCCNPDHLEAVSGRTNTLRGVGWAADLARRTRCPYGHELAPNNLSPAHLSNGLRTCAVCVRQRAAKSNALVRDAHLALGLSQREYRARYGGAAKIATEVIRRTRNEVD